MTIYEEFIKRVKDGETFDINFNKRSLKVGKTFLIKDGCYDEEREFIFTSKEKEYFLSIIQVFNSK